ncbi:hypothetical protein DAI18_18280 [Microvirgula aerodenitrificans]|uniref:HTH cro/C1-type domain-containing protein n=1 Tax=Microvirgula aerodenitrificans TaxID=57480 RepID=A0A2S0PEG3_9NEIS|nr:Cro/CI family transcriptional regulator [Microvirgula aerodenitrificans]AVY95774.1 hypothetical protein DAI18_18280 [Microvirgula aerodenitrificans]
MTNIAQEAVDRAGGSQSDLAKKIGVSPQAVQQWVAKGFVPPKRCRRVSEATKLPLARLLAAYEAAEKSITAS